MVDTYLSVGAILEQGRAAMSFSAIQGTISHDFEDETIESKARWFQGLSIEDRMQLLVEYVDLVLSVNPGLQEQDDAQPPQGRIRILRAP
jgi:hypothetical protein